MAQIDAPKESTLWRFKSIPTAASTCKTCKPALNERGYHPDVSLESLQLSAESGCQDCRLQYLGVLQALGKRDTTADVSISFGRFTRIEEYWRSRDHFDANLTVYFYTEKNQQESSWPLIGVSRTVGPRKTTYLGILREWLKACRENHPDCHKNESVELPTRVLDVGSDLSDSLKLSELPDSKGCYLALSHCWGGAVPMRTMGNNIDAYKEGIDFASLPKNFQDAVIVTRSLGLRYLWIDALCIIQDDKGDWERESGNMASIYQNAYLVIGADMSENSHGGFLKDLYKPYCSRDVPIATVGDETTTIYARCQYAHHWNPCALRNRVKDETFEGREPLLTRAWTLQEQMLASRMVHFARREVIWECDSALSCECMELDRGISAANEKRRSLEALRSSSTEKFELWYDIVINFGQRSITKSSDMLPALSGLAHHFQDHGAGHYLAGLWQNDLPRGLLWSTRVTNHSFRASPYRAPSWSWASIQGENANYYGTLFNEAELQHIYAEFVDAECYAASGDSCGAVKGGWIKIRAPMFEIVYLESSWQHRKAKDTQPSMIEDFDFQFTPNQDDVLSCLFIGDVTMGPPDYRCKGLILRKRHDIPDCTFERVGIFETMPGTLHTFVDDVEKREVVKII